MKTRKITVLAMAIALAMILSYVESLIPSPGIPGVKMGLANIVVVFCLYRLGWKEAAGVSLLRVFLVSLLFGHAASLMYSAAGAVLSLLGMIALKATDRLGCVAVSVSRLLPSGADRQRYGDGRAHRRARGTDRQAHRHLIHTTKNL